MGIYKILFIISLFFYELVVWGDNLPSKSSDSKSNNSAPVAVSLPSSSNGLNPNSSTVTLKDVPINGTNTPINITINQAPSIPAAPVTPQLPPQEAHHTSTPKLSVHSKGKIEIPPTPSLDIVINRKYKNSPKLRKLYKMLGLTNSPNVIHLVTNPNIANRKDGIVVIQPRSFLSILDYLSNAVEITPDIIKKGLVVVPVYPNGKLFNLSELTKGILSIHISSQRPRGNVSVEVYYRDHWFYIADSDYKSKRTFALLEEVFNLQAGETPGQNIPVLTIPAR